jgi:hypothetical protein
MKFWIATPSYNQMLWRKLYMASAPEQGVYDAINREWLA